MSGSPISGVLPMWGEMMQLGSDHSSEESGSGSGSVTSSTAPAMAPVRRARARASWSTWPPRPTLTSQASAGMASSRAASTTRRVSSVRARATTTASAPATAEWRSARVKVRRAPSNGSGERRTTVTEQPQGSSRRISDRVMPPAPSMVMPAPIRVRPVWAGHERARANRWKSRKAVSKAAIAYSATGSAYTPLPQVQTWRRSRCSAKSSIPA